MCVCVTLGMLITPDIDECVPPNPCPTHATCQDTEGSYKCECIAGLSSDSNGACSGKLVESGMSFVCFDDTIQFCRVYVAKFDALLFPQAVVFGLAVLSGPVSYVA